MADAETLTRYRIGGMDCAACGTKIENAVGRLPGVSEVGVSAAAGTMTVAHADALPGLAVERQVKALGYSISLADGPAAGGVGQQVVPSGHAPPETDSLPWWRSRKATLVITCGVAILFAYIVQQFAPSLGHWVFLAALAVGLVPVARRAFAAAISGTPFSIETLMSIAAMGAVLIGAVEEAATVVLLFLVGEMLEGVAAGRARASISGLTHLLPKTALLAEAGGSREVPADTLSVGQAILVRPGDRIPADGQILEGESAIDEAPVTGESVPKRKGAGDAVFAGTINTDTVLQVRVTAAAADNTIARIVKLVEEAQESKAPTERIIERFSRYYTPAVLVAGALVALVPPLLLGGGWSAWIYKGLALLLIGCPCALVISTPAAIAAGLSAGARRGLLLKGGAVLEGLRKITIVAFDKTGTLTKGRPVVTDIAAFDRTERQALSMAAALEDGSSHPLAVAILARAKAERAPIPPAAGARSIAGQGVSGNVGGNAVFLGSARAARDRITLTADQEARVAAFNDEGKTVAVLLSGDKLAALLAIRDEPREDAAAGLDLLAKAGIETVMLTGDNARTAAAIGKTLGIAVRAELLPEDKQRIVRELQAAGKTVAKVGDGINDAPALAAADIGIAMGDGSDMALETADAALLHGRVADIANLVALSRSVMGNIKENISIALGLKAVFLVTTLWGLTGLWPAILADTGATVLVTANAMRLLGWRGR